MALVAALALIWDLTYAAIDVALDGYEPGLLSWARAVGGATVVLAVRLRVLLPALQLIRTRPLVALLFGAFNLVVSFWLIAAGQQTVASR